MKPTLLILIASLLCLSRPVHADINEGMINFKNVSISEVLRIYQSLSGLELVIDSRAKQEHTLITVTTTAPLTKTQCIKLLEKTLLSQAAIVITPLDDKRASVTYNDALPKAR
jgi:type II secretory pathway component GspD/PulD (secretin)